MLTWLLYKTTRFKRAKISIKGRRFDVDLANGFAQKSVGLMYRDAIRGNEGMLFSFPFNHRWKIWMLNMRFPIDTVWLDENHRVVHIERNMMPCKSIFSCKSYASVKESRYVIELKAGTLAKLGIKSGDRISLDEIN